MSRSIPDYFIIGGIWVVENASLAMDVILIHSEYLWLKTWGGSNQIGELRGTSTENVERLGRIFLDMPPKRIHIE